MNEQRPSKERLTQICEALDSASVFADGSTWARDIRAAAEEIERLRWSLAEVKKEVCAVTPDWNRALRIMDQAEWPSTAHDCKCPTLNGGGSQ